METTHTTNWEEQVISNEEKIRVTELIKNSVHSRYRPQFGGYITFYGRDDKSPTGIRSIGGCDASDEYMDFISSIDSRISPLSPTEGFRK